MVLVRDCVGCLRDLDRLRRSELVCLRCGFVCWDAEDMILHLACESHESADCCDAGRVVGFEVVSDRSAL